MTKEELQKKVAPILIRKKAAQVPRSVFPRHVDLKASDPFPAGLGLPENRVTDRGSAGTA